MTSPLDAATAAAGAASDAASVTDAVLSAAGTASPAGRSGIGLIADVPVEVSVVLGRLTLPVRELVEIGPGQVYALAGAKDAPVDVLANGRLVARGQVVAVGDEYGVEITELVRSAP